MGKVALAAVLAAGLLLLAFERVRAQDDCEESDNECRPCYCYSTEQCPKRRCACEVQGDTCDDWSPTEARLAKAQDALGVKGDLKGELGPETKAAIRKFQVEKKLKVKEPGKLDFETYKALRLDKRKLDKRK